MTNPAKFRELRKHLHAHLVGHEDTALILVLGLLTGQPVYLWGGTGCGKTSICRHLGECVDLYYRYKQFSAFTSDSEVLGVHRPDLIVEGRFKRITSGKLPSAEIYVADELPHARPEIPELVLDMLDSGEYENDDEIVQAPLQLFVGMGNSAVDGVAAWDRFALKKIIPPVDIEKCDEIIDGATATAPDRKLSLADILKARAEVADVTLGPSVRESFKAILRGISEAGQAPSGRRIADAVQVLKAYSWLGGHASVQLGNLTILADCLWYSASEIPRLKELVAVEAGKEKRRLKEIEAEIDEATEAVALLETRLFSGIEASSLGSAEWSEIVRAGEMIASRTDEVEAFQCSGTAGKTRVLEKLAKVSISLIEVKTRLDAGRPDSIASSLDSMTESLGRVPADVLSRTQADSELLLELSSELGACEEELQELEGRGIDCSIALQKTAAFKAALEPYQPRNLKHANSRKASGLGVESAAKVGTR